ncbi:MAG: hypothetical protein R3Y43_02320 [Alphaproteobacteria bacterium]
MARKIRKEQESCIRKQLKENEESRSVLKEDFKSFNLLGMGAKNDVKDKLFETLEKYDFFLTEDEVEPISKLEKKLIRIEFYGCVDKPRPYSEDAKGHPLSKSMTSKIYNNIKNNPKGLFFKEDYDDLKNWEMWNICNKSKKFRGVKNKIIDYLQANSIPPQVLPFFNMYDFQDILYETFVEEKGDKKAYLFEGKKQEFVKLVAKKHKKALIEAFSNYGVSRKNIDATLSVMSRYGNCDIYTRDKHGSIFEATDVKLEVHHKKPVSSVGKKEKNIFDVNNFEDLALVINSADFPLHQIVHSFDTILSEHKEGSQVISRNVQRLRMPPNTVFMIGLTPCFRIQDDLSNYVPIKSRGDQRND